LFRAIQQPEEYDGKSGKADPISHLALPEKQTVSLLLGCISQVVPRDVYRIYVTCRRYEVIGISRVEVETPFENHRSYHDEKHEPRNQHKLAPKWQGVKGKGIPDSFL